MSRKRVTLKMCRQCEHHKKTYRHMCEKSTLQLAYMRYCPLSEKGDKMFSKWYLIAKETVDEITEELLRLNAMKALHSLETGLNETDAIPADFDPLPDAEVKDAV